MPATEGGRVAPALRWLGIAALLYPLGRALVDPTFAALGRPVPSIAGRGVVALYFAIPAAAIILARRVPHRRARSLLLAGAALSLLGLALEWAPVRFESVLGAVFSFANDTSINAGVAVLALGVAMTRPKSSADDAVRPSTVLLDGAFAITVGILVEVAWTRVRDTSPPSSADRKAIAYVLGQIAFVTPLLLLAAGTFLRARAVDGDEDQGKDDREAGHGPHVMRMTAVAAVAALALLTLGQALAAPRLAWTLGALAAFVASAVSARAPTR